MRSGYWILVLGTFCLVGLPSFASESKSELTDRKLLHYVGQLRTEHPKAPSGYAACSASRIGRRLILTAEHCLSIKNGQFDKTYTTTFYPSVSHGRVPYGARAVRVSFAWTGKSLLNYNSITEDRKVSDYPNELNKDWAIGYLEEDPFDDDAENADFAAVIPFGRAVNANLIAVGYGGEYGARSQVPLVDPQCGRINMTLSLQNYINTSCFAVGGDSGGPVFVQLQNGIYAQVGIVNTGNRLNDASGEDETTQLILSIITVLAKVPPDYRSSFVSVEQFHNALLQVKTTYKEFHPAGVEARRQIQVQTQQPQQPRPQYQPQPQSQPQYQPAQQPQYQQPQQQYRRGWRRR